MTRTTRRALLAAAASAPMGLLAAPSFAQGQRPRLLVIGGGFGGASAARFAAITYPGLEVTLVEPQRRFVTCPYGNLLLAGHKQLADISFGYERIAARGVRVVHEWASAIDAAARQVRLGNGEVLAYDRLILSPGIALRWGAVEGYQEATQEVFPHAWIPGDGRQTMLLRRQLEALPEGGVVGLAIPDNPFRCPPGPYERISMIASWMKRHRPRGKILAFDAKNGFSKQALFQDAWNELYRGLIEWVPASQDGRILRVDAAAREFESEFGTRHKVDVGNVIPPQSAGRIAIEAGLTNETGWVPVDPLTFESRRAPGIHVIGDATIAPPMPKSGYVANSTAKQAVASAVALLRGEAPPPAPVYFNTCYSHVDEEYGISIVGVFRPNAERTGFAETPNSGGVSPRGNHPDQRRLEALYADAWYASITADMFG